MGMLLRRHYETVNIPTTPVVEKQVESNEVEIKTETKSEDKVKSKRKIKE